MLRRTPDCARPSLLLKCSHRAPCTAPKEPTATLRAAPLHTPHTLVPATTLSPDLLCFRGNEWRSDQLVRAGFALTFAAAAAAAAGLLYPPPCIKQPSCAGCALCACNSTPRGQCRVRRVLKQGMHMYVFVRAYMCILGSKRDSPR